MATPFSLPKHRWEQKFSEAYPLFTDAEAIAEANRCLYCYDAPCTKACPAGIDVAVFIRKIAERNKYGAAKTVLVSNILGYSCGCVCPDVVLCAGSCVLKDFKKPVIQIARLHRYATEEFLSDSKRFFTPAPATGKKVALVGAGPASLACAYELKLLGHEPVIFEKRTLPGGLNTTGIAPYKMTAENSLREVEAIRRFGIEIRTGVDISTKIETLLKDYDAIFIGVGIGDDTELNVPGIDGEGVIGSIEWIEQLKVSDKPALPKNAKRALVVGGGNTALDAARELAKLGVPNVTMVYRRTAQLMPGFRHELNDARIEGVHLMEHAVITEIVREKGKLKGARVRASDEDSFLRADIIIIAIGQAKWRNLLMKFPDVKLNEANEIIVDTETGRTGNRRIYAGGDATPGMKLVVQAVAD
ncbi:FAD-dependent oxidoreductase [bacterium]|nr:FAD-dependent oxidoreductase [bacterium]